MCVFRLVTENTVDDYMARCAENKARLDEMVIQQGRSADCEASFEKKCEMIRFSAEHILSDNSSDVIASDIDKILKQAEAKAAAAKAAMAAKAAEKNAPGTSSAAGNVPKQAGVIERVLACRKQPVQNLVSTIQRQYDI